MNKRKNRKWRRPYFFVRLGKKGVDDGKTLDLANVLHELSLLAASVEKETREMKQLVGNCGVVDEAKLVKNSDRLCEMKQRFCRLRRSLIVERRKKDFLTEDCELSKTIRGLFFNYERIVRHYQISTVPPSSRESCDGLDHYRCRLGALDGLPVLPPNAYFECKSFEERLLDLSSLPIDGNLYAQLKWLLTTRLTFSKNDYLYNRAASAKALAIVAGSYPAHLAKVLASYRDVDVFVLVTKRELPFLSKVWRWLKFDSSSNYGRWNEDSIVCVKEYGKVQFIFKYIGEEPCVCDEHVDRNVFDGFHHCTRWRIDVFDNFFLTRYIYAGRKNEYGENIVADKTSLDASVRKTKLVGQMFDRNAACFRIEERDRIYPQKHCGNILDIGPPNLVEQSLREYLEHCC